MIAKEIESRVRSTYLELRVHTWIATRNRVDYRTFAHRRVKQPTRATAPTLRLYLY